MMPVLGGGLAAVVALIAIMIPGGSEMAVFVVALLAVVPVAYIGLRHTLSFLLVMAEPQQRGPGENATADEPKVEAIAGADLKKDGPDGKADATPKSATGGGGQAAAVRWRDWLLADLRGRARWKPFPWNWLPDSVAAVWGLLEVLFVAPLVGACVACVVPVMAVLQVVWHHPCMAQMREAVPEMIRSVSRPLGRLMLRDPRNHSYLPWMLILGVFTPSIFFWAMSRHARYGLELSTLFAYQCLRMGPRFKFFAHSHTLVHKEGHDHLGHFKGPFRCFNIIAEWWIGPFYGVVPNNYSIAHMKIHHRWHNDVDDVHTNLDLDRTLFGSFLIYVPRFTLYWTGLSPLALLIKRSEWGLVRTLLIGMVAYYGLGVLLWCWSPSFCLCYYIYPHAEACVFLCAISYLWHAFVEESDPGNQYVNSVTVLEGHDNVWNEDFHVVHHHSPSTHWTDAPAHFEKNRDKYAAVNATIFRDTEEGMLLTFLFQKDWDSMAKHFVDLNGKLTHEEKKALIIRRLSVIVGVNGRDGKRLQGPWGWGAEDSIRNYNY